MCFWVCIKIFLLRAQCKRKFNTAQELSVWLSSVFRCYCHLKLLRCMNWSVPLTNKRKLISVGDKAFHASISAEARPTITRLSHLNITICFSDIPSHRTIYFFSTPKPNHLLSKEEENCHTSTKKDTQAPEWWEPWKYSEKKITQEWGFHCMDET